jgi:tetratricopeptide (TPR) repeat protein
MARCHARCEQKKFISALKDIEFVLYSDSNNLDARCIKAAIKIELSEYRDAMEITQSIMEINPQLAAAHYLLGRIEYANPKKITDRGLKHFTTAIAHDARLGEAYYYIGKIHSKNGAVADAMEAFEKADELGIADAAKELTCIGNSTNIDSTAMDQEQNANGAKLDYVSIYIEAIKQLKISGPSPRDLEDQTGIKYKKWLSLFQDVGFVINLKQELKKKIKWAKQEKTKKIWENAESYVDTLVDKSSGRILERKTIQIDTNRKIKGSQIRVDIDNEDIADSMNEDTEADFGHRTTNFNPDNC